MELLIGAFAGVVLGFVEIVAAARERRRRLRQQFDPSLAERAKRTRRGSSRQSRRAG